MAATNSVQIAENALKKMSPPQALSFLSKRYDASKDFNYLLACSDLLNHFNDDVTVFHSLIWQLKRHIHTYAGSIPEKQQNQLLYKKLAIKYVRLLKHLEGQIRLPEKKEKSDNPKRILVLGQQILHRAHAVTMCMLALSRLSRIGGFEDVKLLITNEYPPEPATTFHDSFWAVESQVIGDTTYSYLDEDVPVYSYEKQGTTLESIQNIVDYIEKFDPDVLLLSSDNIIVGDLLADRYPTLCWPLTQNLPISTANLQYYRSAEAPDVSIDWKRLKRTPPTLIKQKFDLATVPESQGTFTREVLRVSEDAFLFAIVGVRIHQEISQEFADMLVRILTAEPRAHLIIVGTNTMKYAPQLVPFADQIRLIRFTGDLRSCLSQCDAYINPPRQGGGNSAYWSMFESLPILTLDNCDVQMTIQQDAAVQSLEELEELALNVIRDPEVYKDYSEKSRAQVASFPAEAASAEILRSDIDQCISEFYSEK